MATGVVLLCLFTGSVRWLENRVYDSASSVTLPAPPPDIALVSIDDASLAALGGGAWSREAQARLVDHLAAAGAKTIVLTTSTLEQQPEQGLAAVRKMREVLARSGEASPAVAELGRLATEAENSLDGDARLATSIQRAGNVLLAAHMTGYMAEHKAAPGTPPALPPYAHRSVLPGADVPATPVASAQFPIPVLGAAAAGVGHLWAQPDDDGTLRRVPLLARYDNTALPSLALLAARHSLHLGANALQAQSSPPGLRLGGLWVATDDAGVLRPRFAVRDEGAPFAVASAAAVLQGKVPAQNFKDRLVLVGATTERLAAPWVQPGGAALYPVEMLAHTVSSIRHSQSVQHPAWAAAAPWLAALAALLFVALALPRLAPRVGWMAGAALLVLLVGAEWGLLNQAGLWVPLLPGALVLLVGTLAFAALRAVKGAAAAASNEATEAERMMGLALQGQGQLDLAFERFRKLPPSTALLENLYHLAQDFERKRELAKAKAVYKHLLQHNRDFKDARARYKKIRAQLVAGDAAPSNPASLPPHTSQLPGDAGMAIHMLGRYQIDKAIGKGAMGVVYQGRDPKIGRVVAIKTLALSEEFEGEALVDARTRFFREAETAGRLQHPCIVTIFDAGEEHNLAYIAMELLKGVDLTDACRPDQLLPVATVLSITARVADALDYAHAHNVVHRDIKPANVMYDAATDAVKVMDFGIARITDSSKTRTGLVLGTPAFMSPEQLAGKKVDGRSDLYSLGVMLFQLLTGSLPLRGDSMPELMHKIASVEAPDVRTLRPELSPAIAEVVARALQKRTEARYQTGRQLAAELRQAAQPPGQGGAPTPGAVVYDAQRDVSGREMVDFQETVMDPPSGRGAATVPISRAR